MKLYVSLTSPYARIPRIVVREKGLTGLVEEIVPQTRTPDSPYYAVNPSGRIPFLTRPDGPGLEGSGVIAAYLDQLDGAPRFGAPPGVDRWDHARIEEMGRSLMDGLAVWVREVKRPESDRSAVTLTHEADRARRLVAAMAAETGHPVLSGPLNTAQMIWVTALELDLRLPAFQWRGSHPDLAAWLGALQARPAFAETACPEGTALTQ